MTKLHPHTKILLLAIVSCLVILLDSPIALFACFLVSLCFQASIRRHGVRFVYSSFLLD